MAGVFHFFVRLRYPMSARPSRQCGGASDTTIVACARCFSRFLLDGETPALPLREEHRRHGTKRACSWSVDRVIEYLEELELTHLAARIRANAVDGETLMGLAEEDFVRDLGLTKLQAKKIMGRLR